MPSKVKKKPRKAARNITRDPVVHGFVVRTAELVPETEFSPTFPQAMYDRMAVSYFKYGALAKAYPEHADAIGSLIVRLMKYCGRERLNTAVINAYARLGQRFETDGDHNTEWLVDVGNFAMIEFIKPSYKNAAFSGTDSNASPGRMNVEGRVTTKNNESI